MRSLVQPAILKSAGLAALLTTLACYPRLVLWDARRLPVWYLELTVLLSSFFLWSFVFAWQGRYAGRDPLRLPRSSGLWAAATTAALVAAALNHFLLDRILRRVAPDDYPTGLESWLAMVLFALSFTQLFLLYSPLAFFLRLLSKRGLAVALTLAFSVFVMSLKVAASKSPPPPALLAELVAIRVASGALLLYFYLKGGLALAWWVSFLTQARYLLTL